MRWANANEMEVTMEQQWANVARVLKEGKDEKAEKVPKVRAKETEEKAPYVKPQAIRVKERGASSKAAAKPPTPLQELLHAKGCADPLYEEVKAVRPPWAACKAKPAGTKRAFSA